MLVLFTDFGLEGPYIGQMKAVLHRRAPNVPVIDLFSDVPPFDPRGAAYLLAAYVEEFTAGTVFVGVVDPGVGGNRRAALVRADGRWFIGPDNGLFNVVAQRAQRAEWWDVVWRPARLSASFHGRDLFAPVAAGLALGETPEVEQQDLRLRVDESWPEDLAQIVYLDHFGNAMTGVRASAIGPEAVVVVGGHSVSPARTFSDVGVNEAFWYENANGLAEIAVNQGRADETLGIRPGDRVEIRT